MTDFKPSGHLPNVESTASVASCETTIPAGGVLAVTPPTFESVYDAYFDYAWRSLRRLGVEEANVDDAVQDVFLVVHRRLSGFEGRSSIKTWLYGVVIRVASDYRRSKARKARPDELSDKLADQSTKAPDEIAAQRQAINILDQILSELDVAKREVFVLTEIEQLTAPEIADVLNLKLNTVYSRLRAARQDFEQGLGRFRAQQARLQS
jgi:RNA polymerase sigma-70 factor (ECF subfamily)